MRQKIPFLLAVFFCCRCLSVCHYHGGEISYTLPSLVSHFIVMTVYLKRKRIFSRLDKGRRYSGGSRKAPKVARIKPTLSLLGCNYFEIGRTRREKIQFCKTILSIKRIPCLPNDPDSDKQYRIDISWFVVSWLSIINSCQAKFSQEFRNRFPIRHCMERKLSAMAQ